MSKRTRVLRAENERLAEDLSKDGKKVLDDMLQYIRGFDIGIYEQEKVRCDITEMLLDGERRGETAAAVIGGDYRLFCDSVLEEIPRLTVAEKVMLFFRDFCAVMAGASLIFGGCYWLAVAGQGIAADTPYVDVRTGSLLKYLLIVAASTGVAGIYTRNPYKSRGKEYLRILISVAVIIVAAQGFNHLLRQTLFTIHIGILLPAAVVMFVIYKLLDSRVG
ncbi:MAG TPA: hypothetical protein H9852_05340 [Candidatus Mediterraneibacter colneyensis]|nr:hypothetical protein [Candidatus Mediterraneibacter colneyensis]